MTEPLQTVAPADAPTASAGAAAHRGAGNGADPHLLEASLRLSHIGLVQIDASTRRFVDVNEGFCRLSGYRADELLAMGPSDLDHPEDRLDIGRFQAMLLGQAEYRQDKRIVRKDGSVRWVEVSGTLLPTAPGRPMRVLGVFQDIDARRRAEDALRAREARLAAALESMADAMVITDGDGRVVNINPAFLALHGLTGKADCPRTLDEYSALFEVTDAAGAPVGLSDWPVPRALRGETGQGLEFGLRRRGGGARLTGSCSFAPIRDAAGAVVGAVVSARDITALRRLNAELATSHAQLRRMMVAVDHAQEQERLRIARELHDELQQSLAAILMEVSAARRPRLRPGGRTALALDRIEQSAQATLTATRRIVHDLRPVVLDELGLVPALASLAGEFTRLCGVDCELDTAALAAADEARLARGLELGLYRVTQEALSNVRRHAGAQRAQVVLASVPGERVRLRISDDGHGFDAVHLSSPPEPCECFGLVGMRERVHAVGGELVIAATPGGGTTIDVVVPLPRAGPAAAA